MRRKLVTERRSNGKKKTRQGRSHRTKYGNKDSKKYYKKRYRGQGSWALHIQIIILIRS